ncbi:MAG: DHA2 family efflux MFS transporter permease subunit [Calditrichaeota bacterium]|nr:DHA2 family efflux MFS transporter permease subunit [Calditrichota bacterium]
MQSIREGFTAFRSRLAKRYPELDPSHGTYRWLVLISIMLGTFMAVLDATIVNVALPKLIATFGVAVDKAEWILTAYLLVFAVMLPSSGWFADHFGYKFTYIVGLLLFTGGSFLCSISWDINALIVARIIQGAGGGFLMPVGMAIVTRVFPPEKRGIALGFWSVSASASVSLGPTIGGYLIDNFSWQTIFDVNLPVGFIALLATLIILKEFKSEHKRGFDFLGFLSLALFLTGLLLALSNGNSAWNTGGWTSNFIITCFAISIISFIVFIITEFTVKHPLIELGLFRFFNFSVSNLILFIFGVGMFGANFLLPVYLQNSLGYTPLQAGQVFLPVGLMLGLTAPFAGIFSDKYSAKIPSAIGMLLLVLTFFQFSTLSQWSEKYSIIIPLIIRGIAMGLLFSPLTTIALTGIPPQKMAQASGLINVIRQVGGSFGVAIFGALLTRRELYHVSIYGQQVDSSSEIFKQTFRHLQDFAMNSTAGTVSAARTKAGVLLATFIHNQAFIKAVTDVFLVAGFTLLLAMIPILFLKNHKRQSSKQAAIAE